MRSTYPQKFMCPGTARGVQNGRVSVKPTVSAYLNTCDAFDVNATVGFHMRSKARSACLMPVI